MLTIFSELSESSSLITDHHNKQSSGEKFETLWELPTCDTDIKWANVSGKMTYLTQGCTDLQFV